MTKLGWLTIINSSIVVFCLIFAIAHLQFQQQDLVTKVDHRFKSYDAFFVLDHLHGDCLKTTIPEVLEYYYDRETPMTEELLSGKWICK